MVTRNPDDSAVLACVLYVRNGTWRVLPVWEDDRPGADFDTGLHAQTPYPVVRASLQTRFPHARIMTVCQALGPEVDGSGPVGRT